MLEVRDLSVNYGHFTALHSVSLTVDPGEIVVMLGANGAGKSTLFRTLSGLQRASGGTAKWNGTPLTGGKPEYNVARGVAQCPEGRLLFPELSVEKNLRLGAFVHRKDAAGTARELERVYTLFPDLVGKRHAPAGSLSGGQQQMVAIARSLMARPQLLLLDEPSLGLAPLVVEQVFAAVQRVNEAGVSVLLAEQNAFAALNIAHRGYVMESGVLTLQGTQQELMTDDRVRSAYLGV
ncbi:leucine/isoleucine/valine transporter ATP-binding subunit [Deinococcus radiopugnans]|uniref:Leucine/isoleucine/valine transporter ATP-binding subunit n=2 Tax=Deinococcus radiopugnans TaxID=57497 RepID=A0A0A7KJB9_9DEIO|nr:ABC transporter ATP-binding protein [Deinococcus radiopugnans]AIZ46190.1 leucine/isoleucine/valine transporter ATP-binding subunit [Deinococcus radiopugnans]MBB6017829.1 branched-chain amino acid transport system ATP-binding protein [Deinococcus radiopugnans ATCC 19172]QLG12089.1 ABC transporter ATP-binding protein [Deinococcus sp. D7000]TNM69553.1 ABC transporter ATP-binding protein [Deinococcus radiopugnans ATCC 19172]